MSGRSIGTPPLILHLSTRWMSEGNFTTQPLYAPGSDAACAHFLSDFTLQSGKYFLWYPICGRFRSRGILFRTEAVKHTIAIFINNISKYFTRYVLIRTKIVTFVSSVSFLRLTSWEKLSKDLFLINCRGRLLLYRRASW
jgi:hypothetical protein